MSKTRLPSAETLEERLKAQRLRVFRVLGVVGAVGQTLRNSRSPIDGALDMNSAEQLRCALELAAEELDSIASALEPAVILNVAPSTEEMAKLAIEQIQKEAAP